MKFTEFLNTLPELIDKSVKITINWWESVQIDNIEWKTGSLRLLQWFLWDKKTTSDKFPLQNFCEFYQEWQSNPEGHHTTINFLDKYNKNWGSIEYIN